jgi:hypothetical protein
MLDTLAGQTDGMVGDVSPIIASLKGVAGQNKLATT